MASHLAVDRVEHTPKVLPVLKVDPTDATGQLQLANAEFSSLMDWTNDTLDATKAKVLICHLYKSNSQLTHFLYITYVFDILP